MCGLRRHTNPLSPSSHSGSRASCSLRGASENLQRQPHPHASQCRAGAGGPWGPSCCRGPAHRGGGPGQALHWALGPPGLGAGAPQLGAPAGVVWPQVCWRQEGPGSGNGPAPSGSRGAAWGVGALLGRARPPGRGAGSLLTVPDSLWPWGLCLAPAGSAWSPLGHLLREAFWGPLTPSFCSSTSLCRPSSGKTRGERGTRGRAGNEGERQGPPRGAWGPPPHTHRLRWQSLG